MAGAQGRTLGSNIIDFQSALNKFVLHFKIWDFKILLVIKLIKEIRHF